MVLFVDISIVFSFFWLIVLLAGMREDLAMEFLAIQWPKVDDLTINR